LPETGTGKANAVLRRLVSLTSVGIALPVAVITAPIWIPLTMAADLVSRLWRFPTLRLALFGVVYLVHQWVGVGRAVEISMASRLGRRNGLPAEREVQAWWATSLLQWANRLLGVDFEPVDLSDIPTGSFILLSRHASMVDAVLPIVLICGHLKRYAHYVLKDELLWDPVINIFGKRLGNQFVGRGSRTEADLDGIARLAAGALPDSALVIFPEGTYATPRNRARVLASLERKAGSGELGSDVVAYAEKLDHLLPPKPAGTLALLSHRPDADVVILGHVGLEDMADLQGFRRRLPLRRPVTVRYQVHPRSELPADPQGREEWLRQQWVELDRWIDSVSHGRDPR